MKGTHAPLQYVDEATTFPSSMQTKLIKLMSEHLGVDLDKTTGFTITTSGKNAEITWEGIAILPLSEFNEIFAEAQKPD